MNDIDNTQETRPRYGVIMRKAGGEREPVVFHPTPLMKDTYRMLYAGNEEPAVLMEGDTFHIQGAILEEQRILYQMNGEEKSARLSPPKSKPAPQAPTKGTTMPQNKDSKSSSAAKGLLYLAGIGVIVLGFLAGIKAIFFGW